MLLEVNDVETQQTLPNETNKTHSSSQLSGVPTVQSLSTCAQYHSAYSGTNNADCNIIFSFIAPFRVTNCVVFEIEHLFDCHAGVPTAYYSL